VETHSLTSGVPRIVIVLEYECEPFAIVNAEPGTEAASELVARILGWLRLAHPEFVEILERMARETLEETC
jgi:hypothetical protein